MLILLLLAADAPPLIEQAQMAYTQCMSAEMDAAVMANVAPAEFARVADRLCLEETGSYREAATAMLVGEQRVEPGFDLARARANADTQFSAFDANQRTAMVASYTGRTNARRGVTAAATSSQPH